MYTPVKGLQSCFHTSRQELMFLLCKFLIQVQVDIWNVEYTYFCELSCMALCNLTVLMFCLLLEIWCRFQFSHSWLASWNTSYRNLQNADRDTVKMCTISARFCPQCCPQTSHDESGHTSVEAWMWRWTLCLDFFLVSPNFLNYYHPPFPICVIWWSAQKINLKIAMDAIWRESTIGGKNIVLRKYYICNCSICKLDGRHWIIRK